MPPEHRAGRAAGDSERLDELCRLFATVRSRTRGVRHELYRRSSTTSRVHVDAAGIAATVLHGEEDGLAARVITPDRRCGFAAASGFGPAVARWTLERAIEGAVATGWRGPVWAAGGNEPLVEQDEPGTLPGGGALERWLLRSREAIAARAREAGDRPAALEMWIEAGRTVECFVASGGLRARRSRTRVWAGARVRSEDGRESNHARAARRLDELTPEGWRDVLPPIAEPRGHGRTEPREGPLVLAPPQAATLVLALANAIHGPETAGKRTVGPGWRLAHDPRHPESLGGGRFDDAGFPTRATTLADGRGATGSLALRGCLRRPSFRDPPVPRASHLRVPGTADGLPDSGLLVTALRIHPVEAVWWLEARGLPLRDGRPRRGSATRWLRVPPDELPARCIATSGPAQLTHLDVSTPHLVFE